MRKFRVSLLSASAVVFFAALASAALNAPPPAADPAPKAEPKVSAQAKPDAPKEKSGATDYDAFSVNDPLYREGSKLMLKSAVKAEDTPKAVKQDLRDAPNSGTAAPAGALKKPRAKKPVHTDPVKVKNAL